MVMMHLQTQSAVSREGGGVFMKLVIFHFIYIYGQNTALKGGNLRSCVHEKSFHFHNTDGCFEM